MHILIYISSIGCVSQTSMDSTDLEIVLKDSGPSMFLVVESPGTPSPVATISPPVEENPPLTTYQSKAPPAVPERGAHTSRVGSADYNLIYSKCVCVHIHNYSMLTFTHACMCIHRYIRIHYHMYDSWSSYWFVWLGIASIYTFSIACRLQRDMEAFQKVMILV